MLNQDKLNKVRGILSAKSGTLVPVFKWGGKPFTFTSNGLQITIPYEDHSKTSSSTGVNGGTITYNGQNYEVDATTGADFSSWFSENMYYKPKNSTTQQNGFAQDKMAGYPRAESLQTPVLQAEQLQKTRPLTLEQITASNPSFSTLIDSIDKIKNVALTVIQNIPNIVPTPKSLAKLEIIDEELEEAAQNDVMNGFASLEQSPKIGTEPKLVDLTLNVSTSAGTGGNDSQVGNSGFKGDTIPTSGSDNNPMKDLGGTGDKTSFLKSAGMQKAGGYGAMVGKAADVATSMFVDKSEFADDDPTQGKYRQMYDSIADSAMAFAPVGTIVGGAMKAVGFVNDIFGLKSDSFSQDRELMAKMGGSYGGSSSLMNEAEAKAGKKYGLFSGSARRRANALIKEAKRQQGVIEDISTEAEDRQNMAKTASTGIAAMSYNRTLSGGYDLRFMRAAKSGAKIQYFKEPFKVNLTETKEFFVTLTDTPPVFKQGGTILDQLDTKHTFSVNLSDPIEELKEGGKIRKNEEGEVVPDKCDACGGDIVVQIHGEPVYLCKECKKFFGVVPFKHKEGGTLERNIEVVETNTTLKSVIPEGALHKNKHHLDEVGIDDSELTKKGIPVVDNDGDLLAEIELNEIIFTLEVTKELEARYKEFYEEGTSESRKDELAIEAGRLLWKEILYNTDDRTGLIDTLKLGGTIGKKSEEKVVSKHALGGTITQEDINIMVKQALINLLSK